MAEFISADAVKNIPSRYYNSDSVIMNYLNGINLKTHVAMLFSFVLLVCFYGFVLIFNREHISNYSSELHYPTIMLTFKQSFGNKLFTIVYPDRLIVTRRPNGNHGDEELFAYMKPKLSQAFPSFPWINMARKKIHNPSLEEVALWGKNRIESNVSSSKTWKPTSLEEIEINDKPGLLRSYTYILGSIVPFLVAPREIHCYHAYTYNNQDAFIVEMCMDQDSYTDEVDMVFQEMIQSISIK